MSRTADDIGFVVIGRNEERNLGDALDSVPKDAKAVVYVDSGSIDRSVAIARDRLIPVHELDPEQNFSAARARKEGTEILLEQAPTLRFIQFLDGDCILDPGWVSAARENLEADSSIGVICGFLSELHPEQSIYNRFNAARWRAVSIGDVSASGGIFMVRHQAYADVGGFCSELLTGEEADLCNRIRKAGYRIVRQPVAMAQHDSGMITFNDWWARAVWGGRGDAIQFAVLRDAVSAKQRKEVRSAIAWGVILPVLMLAAGAISMWDAGWVWLAAGGVLGYFMLMIRIWISQLRSKAHWADALTYATYAVLRNIPYAIGFLGYKLKMNR